MVTIVAQLISNRTLIKIFLKYNENDLSLQLSNMFFPLDYKFATLIIVYFFIKTRQCNVMLDLHVDFISLCQGFIILLSSGERSGEKKSDHKTAHMGKYDVRITEKIVNHNFSCRLLTLDLTITYFKLLSLNPFCHTHHLEQS